jgi:hypothetical protein
MPPTANHTTPAPSSFTIGGDEIDLDEVERIRV